MVLRAAVAVLLCAAFRHSPLLAAQFPYTAYVNADDVHVRGGPGGEYYPTGKLQYGDEIEVYRHDPGGWCAIRPPRDEFSWVATRYLRMVSSDVAEVLADNVLARVGSRFSNARDVWQVKLRKGEKVLVPPRPRGDDRTWTKIAPPSGEFRWVFGKYVRRSDREPLGVPSSGTTGVSQRTARGGDLVPVETTADATARNSARPFQSRQDIDDRDSEIDHRDMRRRAKTWLPDGDSEPERRPSVSGEEFTPRRPADSETGRRPLTVANADADGVEAARHRLEAIDLKLADMVCGDRALWSFVSLRSQAEQVLDNANRSLERGMARRTLARIARFEDIHERRVSLDAAIAAADQPEKRLAATAGRASRVARTTSARTEDPRFDGQGKLIPVKSSRLGAPQFALVDQEGKLRYFVTAAPGVNLRRHQGKIVGVVGSSGYSPELRAQHIMARSVTERTGSLLR